MVKIAIFMNVSFVFDQDHVIIFFLQLKHGCKEQSHVPNFINIHKT